MLDGSEQHVALMGSSVLVVNSPFYLFNKSIRLKWVFMYISPDI